MDVGGGGVEGVGGGVEVVGGGGIAGIAAIGGIAVRFTSLTHLPHHTLTTTH